MGHWTDAYVGEPWSPDFDCAALCIQVQREVFGRDVSLPGTLDWRQTEPQKIVDMAGSMVEPVDGAPIEGDACLMRIRGNRRCLGSHIGVIAMMAGRPWVLHNVEKLGVLFTPEANVGRLQLENLGYYRFR